MNASHSVCLIVLLWNNSIPQLWNKGISNNVLSNVQNCKFSDSIVWFWCLIYVMIWLDCEWNLYALMALCTSTNIKIQMCRCLWIATAQLHFSYSFIDKTFCAIFKLTETYKDYIALPHICRLPVSKNNPSQSCIWCEDIWKWYKSFSLSCVRGYCLSCCWVYC